MKRVLICFLVMSLTALLTVSAAAQDVTAMEEHMARIAEMARQSVVRVNAERVWPKTGGTAFTTSYSGVVWDGDGHIVTAAEAVLGSSVVKIETVDGKQYEGKVLGSDPATHTALVKVDAKGLKPIPIGDSDKVKIGHWVLAIGNPFGFTGSVSYGIVSGVNRQIEWDGKALWNMIQITAPINPGDTGGAVVNSRGKLIGIIHATYGRAPSSEGLGFGAGAHRRHVGPSTMAAEGINFAMPVATVKPIIAQLAEHGEVRRGWLGAAIKTITPDMPEDERQGQDKGVVVMRVVAGSPAIKAGIESGDVLTSYNGEAVQNTAQFVKIVGNTEPEKAVEIKGLRNEKPISFFVTIGQTPKSEPDFRKMLGDLMPLFPNGWLGVHVGNVDPEKAKTLEVPHGAVVIEVLPHSPAEEIGLLSGDIIIKLNDRDIYDALGLKQGVLSRTPEDIDNGVFNLEVLREGKRVSISSK